MPAGKSLCAARSATAPVVISTRMQPYAEPRGLCAQPHSHEKSCGVILRCCRTGQGCRSGCCQGAGAHGDTGCIAQCCYVYGRARSWCVCCAALADRLAGTQAWCGFVREHHWADAKFAADVRRRAYTTGHDLCSESGFAGVVAAAGCCQAGGEGCA